jgi:hypothetical protein
MIRGTQVFATTVGPAGIIGLSTPCGNNPSCNLILRESAFIMYHEQLNIV